MSIYRLPAFQGLNTVIQPHLLSPGQAAGLTDARVETGSIVSIKGLTSTTTIPDQITFNPDGNRSLVKYDGKFYWSDNVEGKVDSEDGFLGLTPPAQLFQAIPNGRGDFVGLYRFAVTFETEGGFESAPIDLNTQTFSAEVQANRVIQAGQSQFENASEWKDNAVYAPGAIVKHQDVFYSAKVSQDNNAILQGVLIQVFLVKLDTARDPATGFTVLKVTNKVITLNDPEPNVIPSSTDTFTNDKIIAAGVGQLISIPQGTPNLGSNIRSFTGFDTAITFRENVQYNHKILQFDSIATITLAQPGVGTRWEDFWDEIGDVTAVTQTEVGSANFLLQGLPLSSQTAVVKRNIYRTTSDGETFYRAAEIRDNATESLVEGMSDSELQLQPTLNTFESLPPIFLFDQTAGEFVQRIGKFLTERNGIFFIAVDNKVYFSAPTNPHSWNPEHFVTYDDDITAMTRTPEGVLVFTNNRSYIQLGDSHESILKREIPRSQGCQNVRTISFVGNVPIWVSNDGICIWDGRTIQIINDKIYKLDFTPDFGEVANDVYYLFGQDKTVAIDFRNNRVFYERSLTNITTAFYDVLNDIFFIKKDGTIFTDDTGANETFTYLTPELDMENQSQRKHFRKIWVESDNDLTIDVLFGGATRQTITSQGTNRRSHFLVPGLIGNAIQFSTRGTGNLKEMSIEFQELPMK